MTQLFTNNASGTISVELGSDTNNDTTVSLQTNEGQLFPNPTPPEFFIATIEDTSGNLEVVKCTGRSGDDLTVERAQENTSARVFPVGSKVELRVTAGTFGEFLQKSGGVMTGELDADGNFITDPVIRGVDITPIARGLVLRGADDDTANQLVVPSGGADPTIGGSVIVTVANSTFVAKTTTLTGGEGIADIGDLSANRTIALRIQELTALLGNGVAGGDFFLVYDSDATAHKRIRYQDAGVPIITTASTTINLADNQVNSTFVCTAGSAVTFNINTGVGEDGNVVIIKQQGAGKVTIAGSATIDAAFGQATRTANSVMFALRTGTDRWTVYGDTSA